MAFGNWGFVAGAAALSAIACHFALVKSKSWDSWFASGQERRRKLKVAELIVTAAVGIFLCLPDWATIKTGVLSQIDSVLLILLVALSMLAILLESIESRHESHVSEINKTLVTSVAEATLKMEEAAHREFFYRWVSGCFLKAVGDKADRFQKLGNKSVRIDEPHGINELRNVANPTQQIVTLVQVVHRIYSTLLLKINDRAKLRVVYFHLVSNTRLDVRYAWDGTGSSFVKSLPKKAKDRFKISNPAPSSAIAALQSAQIIIEEDTGRADEDPDNPFRYTFQHQGSYLKSLLVLPIDEFGSIRHVICVDTDEVGFFQKAARDQHAFVKEHLEKRLLVELGVERLLGKQA